MVLADVGGLTVRDFVKRAMKLLLGDEIARRINLTGQRGKTAFNTTPLYRVIFCKHVALLKYVKDLSTYQHIYFNFSINNHNQCVVVSPTFHHYSIFNSFLLFSIAQILNGVQFSIL